MDLDFLKNLPLVVDNDCYSKIDAYFSKPASRDNSPEDVFNLIQNHLKRSKVREFDFIDYCNRDLQFLEKTCDLIIKYKLDMEWSAKALVNRRMKKSLLEKMKAAGCKKLTFEIITGSDRLLKEIGLSFRKKDISYLVRLAHQSGISVGISLILGFPLETDECHNETLDFLSKESSVVDEIGELRYCLCNYSRNEALPFIFPFCKNWEMCLKLRHHKNLGLDKNTDSWFLEGNYKDYLSRISNLGIPIIKIEPNPGILDHIKDIFEPYSLKKDSLTFFFLKDGKGRLFWKGAELTKGLGLYTSLFPSSAWHDSEHADWQMKKLSNDKMILKGKWWDLPLVQVWEIELSSERKIVLKIEMELLEDVIIKGEQQVNIMLSDQYGTWMSHDVVHGNFPKVFNKEWVVLFDKKIDKTRSVQAKSSNRRLPSVALKCSSSDKDFSLSVLNTSSDFRAHKLKCYKISGNKGFYPKGKYVYFSGEIEIIH